MAVAYFVSGVGESWAVVRMRITSRKREDIVADGLSREAAEALCFQKIEEQLAGVAADDELPLGEDIAPRRQRAKQLAFKF